MGKNILGFFYSLLKREVVIFLFSFFLLSLFIQSCTGPSLRYRVVPMTPGEDLFDHFFKGRDYVIATQGRAATEAGNQMYSLGGNAIDAFAAISFVLSVERPQSTGIGGGGFLVYKSSQMKKPVTFDFREKAPFLAKSDFFLDSKGNEIKGKSREGIFAGGVPGLVAGVLEVHQRYGKLPLPAVMAPSIQLAQKGFKIYPELARALKSSSSLLKKFPSSKKIFFKGNKVLEEGDLLVQKDLAKTLREISKGGRDAFYKGGVAEAIIAEQKRRGGLIRALDLRRYNVVKREPIHGKYKDYDIYSMGPPSSGGIHLLEILNTVGPMNLIHYGLQHPRSVHYTAAAMQQAFADRASHLGDSDFVSVPTKKLTSEEYAKKIRMGIPRNRALSGKEVQSGKFEGHESFQTTHFSIMDKSGAMVSSTQSINGLFGSGLVIPRTGIILNNEMDDFATKVGGANLFSAIGGKKNLVDSEKRPLSSMTPTLILKEGKPLLSLGSPGGTQIITCVAQTILNYIEYELPLLNSISAVRYHHQWYPDELRIGVFGLRKETEDELRRMGYKINHKNLACRIQATAKEEDQFIGVSDPRGFGRAFGK